MFKQSYLPFYLYHYHYYYYLKLCIFYYYGISILLRQDLPNLHREGDSSQQQKTSSFQ